MRILAIGNPTLDLAAGEREIVALRELQGNRGGFSIEVSVLTRDKAIRGAFAEMLATGDDDILHFSGHGSFNPAEPETSAIRFADGMLSEARKHVVRELGEVADLTGFSPVLYGDAASKQIVKARPIPLPAYV